MSNELKKLNGTEVKAVADFGEVFAKSTETGFLRPVKARMPLSEKKGQLYKVAGKYVISGRGYITLNKVASINLVTPQHVMVDGHKRPNPYVERDTETRTISTVNIRKIGVGYSPAGNITVIDKTLYYNIYTYFIQSIQAKMNKYKWKTKDGKRVKTDDLEHPRAALIGTKTAPPETQGNEAWVWLPTMPPLGLWINYNDSAIKDCLEEHTQRQRFGDRIAQTIVERNILKDHPAIGVAQVEVDTAGRTAVTVYGYRHELTAPAIDTIGTAAAAGKAEIDGVVEVKAEVIEDITPDEEKAVVEETTSEEVENGQKKLIT